MPQTLEAEPPSIAESLEAFMEKAPLESPAPESIPAPESKETPATPPPEAPPVELSGDSGELDLTGAVEPKSATEAKPDADEEAKFEEYNRSLGSKVAKEVRRELFKTRNQLEQLKAQLEEAKKASKPEDAALKTEAEALRKKLADVETAREGLAKQLAKVDIQNSPEFKEKYYEPWRQAQQQAVDELSQFTKTNDKGEEVPLSYADLKPLLQLPFKEALAKAKELMGDDYQIAMGHWRTIVGKQNEYAKALETHEAEAQNIVVQRSKEQESMKQLFAAEQTRLKTEFPELYTTDEKNPREHEQAQRGAKLAQAALFGMEGLDPQARVKAAAIVAERAAHFPVLAIRAAGYKAEIERLNKEIENLKNGLPGGGSGSSNGQTNLEESIGESMDKFLKER